MRLNTSSNSEFVHDLVELARVSQIRGRMMPTWSIRCSVLTRPLRTHLVASSQRLCPPSSRTSVAIDSSSMGGTTFLAKVRVRLHCFRILLVLCFSLHLCYNSSVSSLFSATIYELMLCFFHYTHHSHPLFLHFFPLFLYASTLLMFLICSYICPIRVKADILGRALTERLQISQSLHKRC